MAMENLLNAVKEIQKIPRRPRGHRGNLLRALTFGYLLRGHSFKDAVIMAESDMRELGV